MYECLPYTRHVTCITSLHCEQPFDVEAFQMFIQCWEHCSLEWLKILSQCHSHQVVEKGCKPGLLAPDPAVFITVLQCLYENSKRKDFSSTCHKYALPTSLLLLPVRNEIQNDVNKLTQVHLTPNQKMKSIVDKPPVNHPNVTFPEYKKEVTTSPKSLDVQDDNFPIN